MALPVSERETVWSFWIKFVIPSKTGLEVKCSWKLVDCERDGVVAEDNRHRRNYIRMSTRVLLCDRPHRSIALVTSSHALVLRHSPATTEAALLGKSASSRNPKSRGLSISSAVPQCMVDFAALDTIRVDDYRTLTPSGVHGTLGLITINDDVFLCIVSAAARVASIRPGETVQRISSVEFCEWDQAQWLK